MTTSDQKTGILLVQLGTPDEATPEAVRRYLREFLSDRHVVDLNPVLWFFILNFIILTFRPKKSALLYERLFSTYGPVLRTYSKSLATKLAAHFDPKTLPIEYGMRYGNPTLQGALEKLQHHHGCTHILVVPLFPQYSNTTTGSVKDRVHELLQKQSIKPRVSFIQDFYNHPLYIDAVVQLIEQGLKTRHKPAEKLVLSYHGIPQRYVNEGDPYACMCMDTTDLIKAKLNFPKEDIIHCYQSRFGKEPWLQPYTDVTIKSLADAGVREISVACPAFTMDCLETLDEIAIENQHLFREHGGENLQLISCLNDHDLWVQNFAKIIHEQLSTPRMAKTC